MNRTFSLTFFLVIATIVPGCFDAPEGSRIDSEISSRRRKKLFPLQEKQVQNLVRTKDGVGFLHQPTKSTFDKPSGWELDKYGKQAGIVYIKMIHPNTGNLLDVSWMPKNGDLKSAVQIRLNNWIMKDGAENVTLWKTITLRNHTALYISRISRDKNGKKFWETDYFFEATDDHKNLWLITVRTISTGGDVEAIALSMANHLKWTIGPKGLENGKKVSKSFKTKR